MGVDHGGLYITVAQQLLYGADVVVVLQQVGGEAKTQGMRGGVFGQFGSLDCFPDSAQDA
jgi:hypothetical protein